MWSLPKGTSAGKTVLSCEFSHGSCFYLQRMSDKLRLFTLRYMANFLLLSKWTGEIVTSRKVTHSMLLPVIKFKFSSINWNFRKHIPHFETVCFPYSQTFVIRVMVILTGVNLDSLIIKYVKFGRSVVTQWIFSKWSIHNATKSLQRGTCDYHNCTGHLKHKEIQATKLMAKENNLINQEFKKGK